MKLFGREFRINGFRIYHEGDKPTPAEIGAATSGHTHTAMGAATASAAGKAGLVPAPGAGKQGQYLRGDGTWNTPYTHPTTSGYKHIPSGGASGQVLGYSAAGTAAWKTLTAANVGAAASTHTHAAMKGATASAAGAAGMVPAPAAGAQAKFLRGDGTWQTPPAGAANLQVGVNNLISQQMLNYGRVDASGGLYDGDEYAQTHATTDFIPVTANTPYTISTDTGISKTQNYVAVAFYTSAKAFISRPVMSGDLAAGWSMTVTAPANAAYALVSCPYEYINNVKFERGSCRTDWTPNLPDLMDTINEKASANHNHDSRYYTESEITKLLDATFLVKTFTGSSVSISGKTAKAITITCTAPTGYTAIGVIGYYTGNTYILPCRVANGRMDVYNTDSNTISVTPTITMLYAKNGAV